MTGQIVVVPSNFPTALSDYENRNGQILSPHYTLREECDFCPSMHATGGRERVTLWEEGGGVQKWQVREMAGSV